MDTTKRARNEAMILEAQAGALWCDIAKRYGITSARVYQILKRAGLHKYEDGMAIERRCVLERRWTKLDPYVQ